MRSTRLAAAALCLAVFALPTLAEAADASPATAPVPTVSAAEAPAPAQAPPPATPADATACAAQPQATSAGYFGPWCGEPCSDPAAEDFCVGYDCNGVMRIDSCFCASGRWACSWQQCPGW